VSADWARRAELAKAGASAAVCTVVKTSGSTPRKAGASMIVIDDGSEHGVIEGTIGGGAIEHRVRARAQLVMTTLQSELVDVALGQQLGMCCGGSMSVFIESIQQRASLVLFGAGHVSHALAAMAHSADFDVTVCDPRDDLLTTLRFPHATLVDGYDDEDVAGLSLRTDAFAVVATHDHQVDQRLIERLLPTPVRYLALIGSQRKALLTRERCANRGHSPTDIARIICPAGIDIGAETPAEIAVSVLSQMVQCRRGASLNDVPVRQAVGA
jgi:xanthine dehydrogenase accessory factor